jgi:hypothetical protein
MRITLYAGWLLVALGVATAAGSVAAGAPLFGGLMLAVLAATGALMVWMAAGWDTPLADAGELYRYGRPANATVVRAGEATPAEDGTWVAELTLDVRPVNERAFSTTRRLALPGGRLPHEGETVTVKFDPRSRKNVVLLETAEVVEDQITAASRLFAPSA